MEAAGPCGCDTQESPGWPLHTNDVLRFPVLPCHPLSRTAARDHMMMRFAQVTPEGRYVPPPAANAKASYATMVYVRATIVEDAGSFLSRAVTIAVRARRSGPHRPPPCHLVHRSTTESCNSCHTGLCACSVSELVCSEVGCTCVHCDPTVTFCARLNWESELQTRNAACFLLLANT